jgi:hypothetical protein
MMSEENGRARGVIMRAALGGIIAELAGIDNSDRSRIGRL